MIQFSQTQNSGGGKMNNKVQGIIIGIAVIFIPFLSGGLTEILLVADSSTGYIVSAIQMTCLLFIYKKAKE